MPKSREYFPREPPQKGVPEADLESPSRALSRVVFFKPMSKPFASDESARRLAPGEVVGGVYRVVRTLHEGHHGLVVEAEQSRLGRRVALKMLGAHWENEILAQKRLIKEVELLSKLDHPHIVSVIDFNRTPEGEPYLVMELLQGESLCSQLAPGQAMDVPRALTIGSHIASALAAAHAKGICHGTLNPRHVNLTESSGSSFARVFGFALSSPLPGGQSGEHALVPSSRNLAYLAPEQKKPGAQVADELSDQYALSVMLYHMLTGFVPEVRGGVMSLFRRGQSSIAPPSSFRSGIPPALDRVLLRGLTQDPAGRYPRMSDFAAALLEAGRNYLRRSVQPTERPLRSTVPPHSAARPTASPPAPVSSDVIFPSGDRSRRGGERISSPPSSLTGELAELEGLIRLARSAPILSDAVNAILQLLQKAENTMSTQVERRVSDNHRFFEEILQRYLGGASAIFEVQAASKYDGALTPKRAFLLSRVDGVTNLSEVLQLSPLPRLETLAQLAALMRAGLIRQKK